MLVCVVTSPRPAFKDVQAPGQSATLEALRKVIHCQHNKFSSHFRPVLFQHNGRNPRKKVLWYSLEVEWLCTTKSNVYPVWALESRSKSKRVWMGGEDITKTFADVPSLVHDRFPDYTKISESPWIICTSTKIKLQPRIMCNHWTMQDSNRLPLK